MSTIQKFEDLEIWQLARELANEIFILTQSGKLSKDFSLKDLMNRSSGSIMDNIAEGFGRGSRLELIQFLSISAGSSDDLKSQLYGSLDRAYINKEIIDALYEKANAVYKKIDGFINYLNSTLIKDTKFKERLLLKGNSK